MVFMEKQLRKAHRVAQQTPRKSPNASKQVIKPYKETTANLPQKKADCRKQLFNGGKSGPIETIQVSMERIVKLRGILFDLDPKNYREGQLLPKVPHDPERFYKRVVRPWLDRHEVLRKCEVRMTGTGLHAILWLNKPIEFANDGDRERWAGIVKVVQATLPIDPDQPGITATTRWIGSVNTKNGAKVRRITKGERVTQEQVLALYEEMCSAPFRTVLRIMTGTGTVAPCPVCRRDESKLRVQDYCGHCYGSCGKVPLEKLYDAVLAPRPPKQTKRGRCHGKAK